MHALAVLAEEADDRALAERAGHAAVSDGLGGIEGIEAAALLLAGQAHQLAEQFDRRLAQHVLRDARGAAVEHGLLAGAVQDVHVVRLLVVGDVARHAHALLEECDELGIDRVDFGAALGEILHEMPPCDRLNPGFRSFPVRTRFAP